MISPRWKESQAREFSYIRRHCSFDGCCGGGNGSADVVRPFIWEECEDSGGRAP